MKMRNPGMDVKQSIKLIILILMAYFSYLFVKAIIVSIIYFDVIGSIIDESLLFFPANSVPDYMWVELGFSLFEMFLFFLFLCVLGYIFNKYSEDVESAIEL